MIIYGSRMYFKKKLVRSFGECPSCGRYGKMVSYQARKFGHIYFIPLIPMGAHSQVLRECKSCQMGSHMSTDQLDGAVAGLSNQFKSWITALSEGKREIEVEPGEAPINIGTLVADSLDDFYCLGEIEGVDSLVSLMDSNGFQMEKELVLGCWSQLQGSLDQARLHYEAAHRFDNSHGFSLFKLGKINLLQGNLPGAEDAFAKYVQIYPEDLTPVIELATAYEGRKDWPKIVEKYDLIYERSPNTITNAGMKKLYKKACKKSGLQGKFLSQM